MKLSQITTLLVATLFACATANAEKISYSVEKIWDNGMHNAFTSMVKFKGEYYISFREGETHIFDKNGNAEGKIRILHSKNGKNWKNLLAIGKEGFDLRDPKLSITPDGRLMIIVGGSVYRDRQLKEMIPHVIFSEDGRNFTAPQPVNIEKPHGTKRDWLWRVTWHNGIGYTTSYYRDKSNIKGRLFSTTDGINYKYITPFEFDGYPNEATVRFLKDGRMAILLRRDRGDRKAMWGVSKNAEFTEWEWKSIGTFIGGPDFIVLESGDIIAGGRTELVRKAPKTSLFVVDKNWNFDQKLILPSGGDTSYPSFIVVGNELWVSYYSTHETKNASIYLAKIPLSLLGVSNK